MIKIIFSTLALFLSFSSSLFALESDMYPSVILSSGNLTEQSLPPLEGAPLSDDTTILSGDTLSESALSSSGGEFDEFASSEGVPLPITVSSLSSSSGALYSSDTLTPEEQEVVTTWAKWAVIIGIILAIISLVLFGFWLWMLIYMINSQNSNKTLWILALVFLNGFFALPTILCYFLVYRSERVLQKTTSL